MTDHSDELFPDGTRRAGEDVVLVGRYRVLRELGRGAMGTVYLAEDMTLDGLQVAIKLLPAVLAADPAAMAGLKREALLARKLTHPHVVTLRHFEHMETGVFLVMDYVDGKTLAHTLAKGGPLSQDHVLRLFEPLAGALDYAHREGVVHRDIKPSNIMLRSDGTPLLADFGIACEMKESLTRVTGRSSSGTLPYMSPEQFKGEAPAPAHDVYSFAATMYECLAGNPPFHRGQIEWQILNQEPAALPRGSSHLAATVMRGLSKEAGDRPASCRELMAEPAPPAEPTQEAAPTRSAARLPIRHWVLALLVLVGVAVGAWALLGAGGVGDDGSGESSSIAPISSRDASEDTPPPTPPVAAVTATLDSPLEGAWVKTRSLRVSGQVKGDGSKLLLNGEPLAAVGGAFVGQVVAEKDGDLRIEVSTSSGQKLIERTVRVDASRPVIEITSPAGELSTMDQPYARIEGRVVEANLATLTANGTRITAEASGHFMWPATLEAGKPLTIAFRAMDKAGNESQEVTRTLTFQKPHGAFESPVAAAEAAAGRGDWREASRQLDAAIDHGLPRGRASVTLLQGVERWKAPPTLEITSPADGGQVEGLTVRLTGQLKSGRADDRVAVDGNAAPRDSDGRFAVNLPYAKPGTYRIRVDVLDDEGARRGGATRTVTLRQPMPKAPWWAKVSEEQLREAELLAVPVAFENDAGMRFLLVPGGTYRFTANGPPGDTEIVTVTFSLPYYLQMTEVTRGQAIALSVEDTKTAPALRRASERGLPSEHVRSTELVAKLNSMTDGHRYRMPTDIEWVHALRCGKPLVNWWGAGPSEWVQHLNGADLSFQRKYREKAQIDANDGFARTAPVGSFGPNAWGFHDMLGNVSEYCAGAYELPIVPVRDPKPGRQVEPMMLGGNFSSGLFLHRDLINSRVPEIPGGSRLPYAKSGTGEGVRLVAEIEDLPEWALPFRAGFDAATDGYWASARRLLGEATNRGMPASRVPDWIHAKLATGAVDPGMPSWAHVSKHQQDGADRLGLPVALELPGRLRFVLIPKGSFRMGSPASEKGRGPTERRRRVKIDRAFYLQTTEWPNGEGGRRWAKHERDNAERVNFAGHFLGREEQPGFISRTFFLPAFKIRMRAEELRRPLRFPTEAEWEYACRAGASGPYWWGMDPGQLPKYANVLDVRAGAALNLSAGGGPASDGHIVSAPCGSYRPNPWGLFDMLGNVWEVCADPYAPTGGKLLQPISEDAHVMRGGSWRTSSLTARAAARRAVGNKGDRKDIGLRLAMDAVPWGKR